MFKLFYYVNNYQYCTILLKNDRRYTDLLISVRNFVRLLFESGYYSRAGLLNSVVLVKSFVNARALRKASFIRSRELR